MGLASLAALSVLAATSASGAPSSPLDPAFGDDGVATIPGADLYEAQGAPLVGDDGRIAVAGLLKNSSDRIFLGGLTPTGGTDGGFGQSGLVQTSTKADDRRAVSARLADGRLLVAGRTESGRLQLERITAAGVRDDSYGNSQGGAGRLSLNVPGGHTVPVGIATSGSHAFVALTHPTRSERRGFTVAKLTSSGFDRSFDGDGVAHVSFGTKRGEAADLTLGSDGGVFVAGAFGEPNTPQSQTRVARLRPSGALDKGFDGDGLRDYDASQNGGPDHGVSVVSAGESLFVVSQAGAKVSIAKLDGSGALLPSFAGDGIAEGLAPPGRAMTPADAISDEENGIVVVGDASAGGETRWALLRVNSSGSSPLDQTFYDEGHLVLEECRNDSGHGPSGIVSPVPEVLLVAGSCGPDAKVAVARLGTSKTIPLTAGLDIAPAGSAAGHERIEVSGLDPSAVIGQGQTLQGTPLRRTALRRTALRRTPLRRTALRRTPLRRTALGSTLLSELPLFGTTWQELLGVDFPTQTLTFEDAFEINPEAVADLTLDDIDPEATALRRTSLAALVLGPRPLSALPPPDGGWCAFLAGQPYDCGNGADPATSTLFDLEIGGDDLSGYYEQPIELTSTDLGTGDERAPLADYRLAEIDLGVRPFRDTKAEDVASLLACDPCEGTLADQSPGDLGEATIGDLVGLLPTPSLESLSVGQTLGAIIPASEIPYELMDRQRLLDEAEFRAEDLQAYAVDLTATCGARGGLRAVLDLAGDARPVPGSATLAVEGGPAEPLEKPTPNADGDPVYDIASLCATRTGRTAGELAFDVEAGSVLGFGHPRVRIESEFGSVGGQAVAQVDDSRDPGDDVDHTLPLPADEIRTGHIASDTDVDTYAFTGVPGKTTISLAHLPEDYDLFILGPDLGPPATPLRRTALRRTDLSETALPDSSEEPTDPAVLPPDTVEDLALRRTPLRRTALRRTSINRGTADEAATIEIRPEEAGETFYAQVVGYNGAASGEPYVIRRIEDVAEGGPPCPPRPLESSLEAPFPETVPENTEALYLVHPGRMAASAGPTGVLETEEMLDRLDVLAGNTNGVVVPVDADPQVDTDASFAALDQDPCSPARANAVVADVNAVVDHVREMGNGLPDLRSIVLVGPDEVLSQARIPDHTVIGNEGEYADEATIDADGDGQAEENSASGGLRQGFVLSDDPYGDFDPGIRLWVPDVALGRLVETPDQVTAQINDFLSRNGTLEPSRAFVTGYDFISDGATAQLDAVTEIVGESNAQSRIDETWSAADAAAGLDAPGAGLLAVNAHYDHHRLLPAAAFNGFAPDLLAAADTSPPPGSAVFNIGCHGGLNLAVSAAGDGGEPRLADWAERMAAQRASIYAGNTGYGYGDTEAVAYSELLMAEYASNLATRQMTTGQALMFAKQATAANLGVHDDYWSKASHEATFYGLPMYEIGSAGQVAAAAVPEDEPALAAVTSGPPQRSSTRLDFADLGDRLEAVETARGTFWRVGDEEPLVVQHRPIQPKTREDVTLEGEGEARGYLFEEMVTTDLRPVDPVIAAPTIDSSEHEPEPGAEHPLFPARQATVAPEATPEGRRDTLTLVAGSFREDAQRLMSSVGGRVLRSTSDDFQPPTIRRVDGHVHGSVFSVRVEVEGDDILGGNVLYLTDADVASGGEVEWHRAELSVISEGVLGTGGTLPSGTRVEEALVQVYDTSHNLAVSNNKVDGHSFAPPPAQGETPRVVLDPPIPASGYYESGSPSIALEAGPEHEDAVFEYSVDGGEFERYDGPFELDGPAEGHHSVIFRGSDGSGASQAFAVDTQPPTIVADLDRTPNGDGWHDGPVTVSFTCADAVSGVASCPDPITITEDGRNHEVSGTATDGAGHSSTVTVDGIHIDSTPPATAGQVAEPPNEHGWYTRPVDVVFGCADDLSGLATCGDQPLEGAPRTAARTVAVSAEGEDQSVTRGATDVAGNSATATVEDLDIDLTDPTVSITTEGGRILVGEDLEGQAFDATSGVASVRVTYTGAFGTQTREAELDCNPDGTCSWTAPLPGTGIWEARAIASDHAGRTGSSGGPVVLKII